MVSAELTEACFLGGGARTPVLAIKIVGEYGGIFRVTRGRARLGLVADFGDGLWEVRL